MKSTSKSNVLTEGSIPKHLFSMSWPMVFGILAVIGFNAVDTYFVSLLGTQQLAALTLTFPVVFFFGSMSIGVGVGVSSVISRTVGQEDATTLRKQATYSLLFALVFVAFFLLVGLICLEPLFLLLGATSETLPFVKEYMLIWLPGMLFLVVPMVGNSIIRALGEARFPALLMVFAGGINALLDPLFIFGWGFFPAMGIRGAAIATVIARFFTFWAMIWFLHQHKKILLWELPNRTEVWEVWKKIIVVSIPASVSQVSVPIASAVITALVAKYGVNSLAGFGVATRIEALSIIGLLALSAGISPLAGQNWGANKIERVRELLKTSFVFVLVYSLCAVALLWFFAPWLVSLFNKNSNVQGAALLYLQIVPFSFFFLGIAFQVSSTLNAIGKPLPALGVVVSRTFLFCIPLAWIGHFWGQKTGVFVGVAVGNLLGGCLALLWVGRILFGKNEVSEKN